MDNNIIPESMARNRRRLKDAFSGAYARGLKNVHWFLTVIVLITSAVFILVNTVVTGFEGLFTKVPEGADVPSNAPVDSTILLVLAIIAAINLIFLVMISLGLRKSYIYFNSQEYSDTQAYERIFKTSNILYDPRRLSMLIRIYSCIKTITALFIAVMFIADAVNKWNLADAGQNVFSAVLSTIVALAVLVFCISAVAVCIFEGKAWENFADVYDGLNVVSDTKTFLRLVKIERILLIFMICLSAVSIVYSINIITLPFLCVFFYYDKCRMNVAEKFIQTFGGIDAELLDRRAASRRAAGP